jgi:hypothetical protein
MSAASAQVRNFFSRDASRDDENDLSVAMLHVCDFVYAQCAESEILKCARRRRHRIIMFRYLPGPRMATGHGCFRVAAIFALLESRSRSQLKL